MIAVGQRFGRLTVIGPPSRVKGTNHYTCLCACDCGRYSTPYTHNLVKGRTLSCGCLQRDRAASWWIRKGRLVRETESVTIQVHSIDDEVVESEGYVRWMARAGLFGVGADRTPDYDPLGLESAALRDAETRRDGVATTC